MTDSRPSALPPSPDRAASLALLTGVAAGLLTMAFHPTGKDVVRDAAAGGPNLLAPAVHTLGLLGLALQLAGCLALPRRLRTRRDLAVGGSVLFALGSVAAMVAVAASGFIGPGVVRGLDTADEPTRAAMRSALRYTWLLNQTFSRFHVALGGAALLCWSAAILAGRELPRALGLYGLLLGGVLLAAMVGSQLRLDVHGFGLVVLAQSVWMGWAAARLWRPAGPLQRAPAAG